jgi:hypothetical protein
MKVCACCNPPQEATLVETNVIDVPDNSPLVKDGPSGRHRVNPVVLENAGLTWDGEYWLTPQGTPVLGCHAIV